MAWRRATFSLGESEVVSYGSREEWARDDEIMRLCSEKSTAEVMEQGAQIGQVMSPLFPPFLSWPRARPCPVSAEWMTPALF